jgi:glutaconate CoA-transferase, subunit B
MSASCSVGEVIINALARTIEDHSLVFHGFGSPLVQLAMYVAKRTHASNMVLVAGATYGINPKPLFLTPTSNDWALDHEAECTLEIGELFDLGANGRMDKMFLSGIQIDRWGNANVTGLGASDKFKLKLPGGGGGCNLSCDVKDITLWTAAHRAPKGKDGKKRFRLVESCDFITNLGHRAHDGRTRTDLGHRGGGPQWLVTELGLFDFNDEGHMRLRALFPDVSVDDVAENTGFDLDISDEVETISLPSPDAVAIIRDLDPLKIHEREIQPADKERRF